MKAVVAFWKENYGWILLQIVGAVWLVAVVNQQEKGLLRAIGRDHFPHFGFRVWLPVAVLAVGWILFTKWRWFFLALMGTLISFVLIADRVYFTYFDTLPTLLYRIPIKQALTVSDSFFSLLHPAALLPLGAMLLLWVLAVVIYRSTYFEKRVFGLFIAGKLLGLAGAVAAFLLYVWAAKTPVTEHTHHINRADKTLPGTHWGAQFSNLDLAGVYGVMTYHLHDYIKLRRYRTPSITLGEASVQRVREVLVEVKAINDTPSPLYGIAPNHNVIIVQLEAFQYWLLGAVYEGVEVTPFLNQLYEKGLSWQYIYDATSIGRTSDAEFTLHTGLYSDQAASSAFSHTNKQLFTFGKALKQKGYHTYSFHGFKKDFWNRTNTHPFFGIETIMFREDFDIEAKLGLGFPDKVFYPEVARYLETQPQPFYAFIISLSCHHPFRDIPADTKHLFPGLSSNKELATYAGYLKLARYADDALAMLYRDLETRGLLDNSVLVVYGDHDFGQLNPGQHPSFFRRHFELLDETLGLNPYDLFEDRIPLAMVVPSRETEIAAHRERFSRTPGTLADVFPTVFHLLGEPVPTGVMGAHLLQEQPRTVPLPKNFDHVSRATCRRFFTRDGLFLLVTKKPRAMAFHSEEDPAYVPTMLRDARERQTINDLLLRYDMQPDFLKP